MKTKNKKILMMMGLAFCLVLAFVMTNSKTRADDASIQESKFQCLSLITGLPRSATQNGADIQLPAASKKLYDDAKAELFDSDYSDWSKSPNTLLSNYHETINKKFNAYIQKMMAGTKGFEDKKEVDPNAKAPPRKADGTPGDCTEANYSTYCVAVTLYSDKKFGYKALRDVLSCRKYEIFANSQEGELFNKGLLWSLDAENKAQESFQAQKAISVSGKVAAIEDSLKKAKKALDQTLSAYDQLKLAWAMHRKYYAIYKSLLKYRDLLAEIRRSVETFPAKFIDASTTKCI